MSTEKDCEQCGHNNKSAMAEPCRTCGIAMLNFEPRKPITNYDRIISKSPEELAKWLGDKDTCPPECWKYLYDDVDCAECWLAWMKQEASE